MMAAAAEAAAAARASCGGCSRGVVCQQVSDIVLVDLDEGQIQLRLDTLLQQVKQVGT
jgi:hypothetical protein